MSRFPEPSPGHVLRYAHLWWEQAQRGMEDGEKVRPAVVVLVVRKEMDHLQVTVASITHTAPADPRDGFEIPAETCKRIGLDERRQWAIAAEVNSFAWPGPDLRPKQGKRDNGGRAAQHFPAATQSHS